MSIFNVSKSELKLLLLRCALSSTSMFLLWGSFSYLSLGLFSAIQNMGPIITIFVAFVVLKERLSNLEIINITVSFIGVIWLINFSTKPTTD